jgi:hypothetical protein
LIDPLAASPQEKVRALHEPVRDFTTRAEEITKSLETCRHPAARLAANELVSTLKRLAKRLERASEASDAFVYAEYGIER